MKRYVFSYNNIQLGTPYTKSITLPKGKYIEEIYCVGNSSTGRRTMHTGTLGLYLYTQADEYRQSGDGVFAYETVMYNSNGQPFNLNFQVGFTETTGNIDSINFIFTRIN